MASPSSRNASPKAAKSSSRNEAMGRSVSRSKRQDHEGNVLMWGPPGAGRRTLLAKWTAEGRTCGISPGLGIRIRELASGAMLYTAFGYSGGSLHNMVRRLCKDIKVILFIVDSTKDDTIHEVAHEIREMSTTLPFCMCRYVIAANKQDGKAGKAHSSLKLSSRALLNTMTLRQKIQYVDVSALTGQGLVELYTAITRKPKALEHKDWGTPRGFDDEAIVAAEESTPFSGRSSRGLSSPRSPVSPSKSDARTKSPSHGMGAMPSNGRPRPHALSAESPLKPPSRSLSPTRSPDSGSKPISNEMFAARLSNKLFSAVRSASPSSGTPLTRGSADSRASSKESVLSQISMSAKKTIFLARQEAESTESEFGCKRSGSKDSRKGSKQSGAGARMGSKQSVGSMASDCSVSETGSLLAFRRVNKRLCGTLNLQEALAAGITEQVFNDICGKREEMGYDEFCDARQQRKGLTQAQAWSLSRVDPLNKGKISQQDCVSAGVSPDAFRNVDDDDDGFITQEQFIRAKKHYTVALAYHGTISQEKDKALARADKDGDGMVSLQEALAAGVTAEMFKEADRDNKYELTPVQFRAVLTKVHKERLRGPVRKEFLADVPDDFEATSSKKFAKPGFGRAPSMVA